MGMCGDTTKSCKYGVYVNIGIYICIYIYVDYMMEYNQERRWDTTESYFSCDLNNKEAIGFNGIYGTSWNINGKLGMAMFGWWSTSYSKEILGFNL